MKQYKAILFDLDGTLLPMDTDTFVRGYFTMLGTRLVKYGIPPKKIEESVYAGVFAMLGNDGTRTNEEAFWGTFEAITGHSRHLIREDCEDFYAGEFAGAKVFTGDNPLAVEAVKAARAAAPTVVLATNPLFPMSGQRTRLSWIGLTPEDFDLVTHFRSDSFCKPDPRYFYSVFDRIGVGPEDCLMIGNDEREDMYAGTLAGMDCYLVTDCLLPCKDHPWDGPRGTFPEMLAMLRSLAAK